MNKVKEKDEFRVIVDSSKKPFTLGIKELVRYKDLLFVLSYRDLRVRYAQTFLGLLWAVLQPLATLLIFTVVFGRAVNVDTGKIPYPLFAICGMAAWAYFGYVLSQSGNSIITSQEMVKKIYFPRLIIPLSKAMAGFVDFAIALIFIAGFMFYFGIELSYNIFFLPIFILLTIISALAVGIWLSALTIRYRDFQHVIPFLVQFGLYATPVGYPSDLIIRNLPEWATILFYFNPMAGIVEGFRWSIIGGSAPSPYTYFSFGTVILIFVSGLYYFKKTEHVMADIV